MLTLIVRENWTFVPGATVNRRPTFGPRDASSKNIATEYNFTFDFKK